MKCPIYNSALKAGSNEIDLFVFLKKTEYFQVWFLYKSDLCISTSERNWLFATNSDVQYLWNPMFDISNLYFWSNKSHSLKFQRFTTLESKDIGIRKSEFVAKTQFLLWSLLQLNTFQTRNVRQNLPHYQSDKLVNWYCCK